MKKISTKPTHPAKTPKPLTDEQLKAVSGGGIGDTSGGGAEGASGTLPRRRRRIVWYG